MIIWQKQGMQFCLYLGLAALLCACSSKEDASANIKVDNSLSKELIQLRDTALQSNRAFEILESLTTEVGPRLAGTEANERAVLWAQKMLEQSGFDRVWLEPVEFPVWRRHSEYARVISPYPQDLRITALGYSGSTDGEMIGDIVKFDTLGSI